MACFQYSHPFSTLTELDSTLPPIMQSTREGSILESKECGAERSAVVTAPGPQGRVKGWEAERSDRN